MVMDIKIPKIEIGTEIKSKLPNFRLAFLSLEITNIDTHKIEEHLKKVEIDIKKSLDNESIKNRPMIKATRLAYKSFGKDPNRYRPAAEQLARRILSHGQIYRVSPIVDLGNILSLLSGYSIGVFDASKVYGDIKMGLGKKDEEYFGIGRGAINIENLPVYRDELGAFASASSDEERTKILPSSKFLYIFINDFSGNNDSFLEDSLELAKNLFTSYCGASNVFLKIIN